MPNQQNQKKQFDPTTLKAMAMAFSGFTLWVFGDAVIRFLRDYPTMLLAFLSSVITLILLCIFAPKLGGFKATFTRPKLGLRIARGFIISLAGFLSYTAFTQLEMADAYALIFLAPFLAKIFSVFLTGEKISARSWAITALGFVGVLIALRPGHVPLNIGSIAALGLALFFSLGYTMGRFIGEENQTPLSIALFTYAFITLGTAYPAFQIYQNTSPEFTTHWPQITALFILGGVNFAGSILVGKAYTEAPSAYIAPLHYTQILWGIALGALLFGEYPDLWTAIGSVIIIIAGILLIRYSASTK